MKQHTLKPAFVKLKTFGFRLLSMPQNIYLENAVTPDELHGQTHENQTLVFIRNFV